MSLLVQKFGGTSVASPERIRAVADSVARCIRRGDSIALVISAMGKETDELLHLASQVSSTKPGREMDMLVTAGERKAISLVCMALMDLGIEAHSFTGSQAGFLTDTNHRNARILEINPKRIKQSIENGIVPVVAGSQGVSTDNDVTFLGRGGSDTTAVGLANALGADSCELYTDVSGVYSADPRIVPRATKIRTITFNELLEMTATGCPKPALRSVEFAHSHNVSLHIRSAFTWEIGTFVVEEEEDMETPLVRAVTHDDSDSKFTLREVPDKPGVSAALFEDLANKGINVDMIFQNTSEQGVTDISFTVNQEEYDAVQKILDNGLAESVGVKQILTNEKIGKVSLVGAGMKSNPGAAAKMFKTLGEEGINIDMISTSPIRISCCVEVEDLEKAVLSLHEAFGLSNG